MTASASQTADTHTEQADLENLAAELTARGYHATLHTPPGRLPYLHVQNPDASVLNEKIYAQADSFFYSWAERIAGCDQVSTAAGIIARVLRTVDSE